jgi:hypothetical protein
MRETFISSLSSSLRLSAAMAAVGVLIALLAIERVPRRRAEPRAAISGEVGAPVPAQAQVPTEPTRQ